ncbi:MAG: hypothetical protein ACYS8W_21475 [Planctomycetota bacterium]|jgi:hypothetical protein
MKKLIIMVALLSTGCASPMTAGLGIETLRSEYDDLLSRGPDREKLMKVREFFLSNPGEAKSKLMPLLNGDNRRMAVFAIETCSESISGDKDLQEALENSLSPENKSRSLRFAAAEALAAQGIDRGAKELVGFLKDKKASRRVRAMLALARPGWKYGAKEIAEILNDRETISIWMPMRKHFIWVVRWESDGILRVMVREIALLCLSRMAERNFGWQLGDNDLKKLDNACKQAIKWVYNASGNGN